MTQLLKRAQFLVRQLALFAALSGCASFVHGSRQEIGVSSAPYRATVRIDGTIRGLTPVVVELSRRQAHRIRIELDGYQPYEASITRNMSGWLFGNVLLGAWGIIGIVIDVGTGAMYTLSPDLLSSELARMSGAVPVTPNSIHVLLVERPDSAWQRIGTLRLNRAR
jgi:uncharacterized Fe-S cluster-containing radical SAM superfamily protein